MADNSLIEWTEATWNVVTGCEKKSAGCKYCYALREWPRLAGNPNTVYYKRDFTDIQFHPERLSMPLRWRRGRKIFVNAMSDLFHDRVDTMAIAQVFAVMALADHHTFQILTKRADRMRDVVNALYAQPDLIAEAVIKVLANGADPSLISRSDPSFSKKVMAQADLARHRIESGPLPNVHLGVSVEDQAAVEERLGPLQETRARVRWVSAEPLLAPIDLRPYLGNSASSAGRAAIVWVVVGGESGRKARPMPEDALVSVVQQCLESGTAVNVKQRGEWVPDNVELAIQLPRLRTVEINGTPMRQVGRGRAGRLVGGVLYDAYPPEPGEESLVQANTIESCRERGICFNCGNPIRHGDGVYTPTHSHWRCYAQTQTDDDDGS